MSFSDRIGLTQPRTALQIDSIDRALLNGLWQACLEHVLKPYDPQKRYHMDSKFKQMMSSIYVDFFKRSSDVIPYGYADGIKAIRDWFFKAPWWQIYNFVEYLIDLRGERFSARVSIFLEREKSGYRIIHGQLVPITDEVELGAVSEAASVADRFSGARTHLRAAVQLFSRKPEADYRNTIKESISAVESIARVVSGNPKATLSDALKAINDSFALHPALREAMVRLYGYTSDEAGIRHALLEESSIDEAEAKFMLVACSAFVNLCIQRVPD